MLRVMIVAVSLPLIVGVPPDARSSEPTSPPAPRVLFVDHQDPQAVIDQAPAHSIVNCNRNHQLTLSSPLRIKKPLTLRGLNARLPDGLGKTSLVVVEAEGVTVTDFELHGNTDTVDQVDRAPLMRIRAGDFLVENGTFHDSSKDGVEVHGGGGRSDSIVGGVLRNLTGYNIVRDVVSLSGDAGGELPIRDILVENIRCFGSPRRGAVEVSDGTRNITVRKVYAEDCVYAVDIQDHRERGQVNRNVVIEDVYASRCQFAIRMAVRPFGHRNITLKDITAENCLSSPPLSLNHVDQLTVSNVRVADYTGESPMTVTNCDGVILRDVFVERAQLEDSAIRIEDCNQVFVSGVIVRGGAERLTGIVKYLVASNETFSGLQIDGVLSSHPGVPPLVMENTSDRGRLEHSAVSHAGGRQ